jgi:hypothetical protein
MAGKIQFTLNGEAQEFAGEVTGKGSLKLETDATSLCFALDYLSKDKIILTLAGDQGIKLSAGNQLKFSGSVSRDLVNRQWQGEYALKLEISQSVAARLSQEFTKKGTKTSAEITIRF